MRPAVRIGAGAAAGRRLRMDEIVIALDRLLALAAARLGPAATGHERHERTPIELAAWLHCIFPWACFASAIVRMLRASAVRGQARSISCIREVCAGPRPFPLRPPL